MHIKHILPRFSYLGLLIFMVFFFVVAPFYSEDAYARLALDISIVILLILSVYMCSDRKHYVILAVVLAAPHLSGSSIPALK